MTSTQKLGASIQRFDQHLKHQSTMQSHTQIQRQCTGGTWKQPLLPVHQLKASPFRRTTCIHGQHLTQAQSRRAMAITLGTLGTVAVVGGVAAAAIGISAANAKSPRQLVQSGMEKFRKNDVEGSAADFDAAWNADPSLRPFLWQRGLSYYYLGKYEEGAVQFRSDVAVNPNDTEEAIWTFLCEARTVGPETARQQFLRVGRDSRPVMRAAYETFLTGSGPQPIRDAISDNGGHSTFYGQLYIGLYHEAHGSLDDPAAREAITAACATPYAKLSNDYMASLARIHCLRRGWPLPA